MHGLHDPANYTKKSIHTFICYSLKFTSCFDFKLMDFLMDHCFKANRKKHLNLYFAQYVLEF